MSSATIAAAIGLQQNDYLTVALFALISYDYFLTLPREIDYIWNKRWTMVSTLFLLVRYCGLYILIVEFLPTWPCKAVRKPLNVSRVHLVQAHFQGEILYLVAIWAFVVFVGSADLVMILRVWAMFNRSRLILGFLLTFWVLEIIPSIITCIMYPNGFVVTVTQVLDLAYCGVTSASVTWTEVSAISEIINGAVMCSLVIFQFVKRVVDMYRVTKRWHFNRYMNLLLIQNVLYFLFIIFFNRTAILVALGQFQTQGGWPTLVLLPLEYVPAFALTPRFILSIRALHPHDRHSSQGREIDAGFGLSSPRHAERVSTTILDVRQPRSEVIEQDTEMIPMREWRITLDAGNEA